MKWVLLLCGLFGSMTWGQGLGSSPPVKVSDRSMDLKPVQVSSDELRSSGGDRNLSRGQELAMAGDYEKALPFLERSRQSNPNNAVVWYWIGYCQEKIGNTDAAIQSYETALQKNPRLSIAWWGKGVALLAQKKYDAAYDAFQQFIIQNPREPGGYFYAGVAQWMSDNIDSAIGLWERSISMGFADSAQVWGWIGDAHLAKERLSAAEEAYRRALRAPTAPPEVWLGMGRLHIQKGSLDTALSYLMQAEALLPEDPTPPYYRGIAHLRQKDTTAARVAFQKALQRSPDHARSLYEMGRLVLATEGVTEAQKYYEKLKSINTRLAQQLLREIIDKK